MVLLFLKFLGINVNSISKNYYNNKNNLEQDCFKIKNCLYSNFSLISETKFYNYKL